jgi:hypothetical protein
LPEPFGRRRAVPAALVLTAVLLASLAPAAINSASAPAGLERFLYALGEIESGGSYTARNPTSGAYGKYQILPSSWAAWAKAYLGSSTARPTPANQEIVAHRKVTALFNWLDSWAVVAHWWLTGSSDPSPARWSSFSRTYVNRVIALMKATPDAVGTITTRAPVSWIDRTDTRLGETAAAIVYRGSWSTARYAAYSGRQVKYATKRGSTASLVFTGKGIAWMGPVGPTRGTARVYVDGKFVRTVNLRRSSFHARVLLFSKALPSGGQHTIRILVTSSGRPVAIDELIVGT